MRRPHATAWELVAADGTALGRLDYTAPDMPWFDCRFSATPAFAAVAPLFERELALLNAGDMEAWEEAYERIAELGMVLHAADGGGRAPIREFILHVEGEHAWFRC